MLTVKRSATCSTRGGSQGTYITFASAMRIRQPALALKPRGDVTRNPKQGYQWPQNRTCVCVRQKYLKKKKKKSEKAYNRSVLIICHLSKVPGCHVDVRQTWGISQSLNKCSPYLLTAKYHRIKYPNKCRFTINSMIVGTYKQINVYTIDLYIYGLINHIRLRNSSTFCNSDRIDLYGSAKNSNATSLDLYYSSNCMFLLGV